MEIVDDQRPRGEMRVSDADRERVAEQLRTAHGEGRLDLTEFDERVRRAWAAVTYRELDGLTTDLPASTSPAPRRDPRPDVRGHAPAPCARRSHRGAVAAWLSASVINLVIWAVISLTTLSWVYPWWIWVAGPWGAILLIGWLSERGRRDG